MEVTVIEPASYVLRFPLHHHGVGGQQVFSHYPLTVCARVSGVLLVVAQREQLIERAMHVHGMLGKAWVDHPPAHGLSRGVFQRFGVGVRFPIDGHDLKAVREEHVGIPYHCVNHEDAVGSLGAD
jgi:hypothetical protein